MIGNFAIKYVRNLLRLFLLTFFILFFSAISIKAQSEFELNLSDFYQKKEKASKILKEIETDLINGSREKVCTRQREAASYGIEATETLIEALKKNGSTTEIQNLQAGLIKWIELRDNCY